MFNPFGPDNEPNSYFGLHKRILHQLRLAKVEEQMADILRETYETFLTSENIVLSRPERKRLLMNISKTVLEDVTKKLAEWNG